MSSYSRVVTWTEKYAIAYDEQRPPFVIQLVLEGKEEPDPERLYDALAQTTEANPGSSLVLDRSGKTERWIVGPPPTLTVVDAPEFGGDTEVGAPFLRWPMSPFRGPTCELVSVRGKDNHYLVFRASHAVMDGHGTISWVRDFARCLRGEDPVGHPSTMTLDDLLDRIDLPRRTFPDSDALSPVGPPDLDAPIGYQWRRMTVPRPLDSGVSGRIAVAIAERARAGGIEGVARINLPTNLRHYQPDERSTGNLYSGLFLDVPPGASPDMVGLRIVRMLYKNEGAKAMGLYATNQWGSLDIFRTSFLWDLARIHSTGLYPCSATLSHLGVLKQEELTTPAFETASAFFVPQIAETGCVVTLNGFDEHTEAAVGMSGHFASGGRLDELAGLLRSAIEGEGA